MTQKGPTYQRLLKLAPPPGQSIFLWGARKTGKSTYLKSRFPKSLYYDLLHTETYIRFSKEPWTLREHITSLKPEQLKHPIIIDEVQRIPILLNEVHWLIENTPASFILCGSSARQLKRIGSNLLGGRAWKFEFFPLVYTEIPNFDLLRAISQGLIPNHYNSQNPELDLEAYVSGYLAYEIQAEGLARDLGAFSRFLESVAFSHGEILNYENIARDCYISAKTVQSYYQILVDTLLGYFIYPYNKKVKREIISATPRFYLFDTGIANYLAHKKVTALKGTEAGNAFEHFILMELIAYKGLCKQRFPITYWRTQKHEYEVDFVLGNANVAIEAKLSDHIQPKHLRGLKAFAEEHKPATQIIVSREPNSRLIETKNGNVQVLPYQEFIKKLWAGELI